jgi:hypothetical protein
MYDLAVGELAEDRSLTSAVPCRGPNGSRLKRGLPGPPDQTPGTAQMSKLAASRRSSFMGTYSDEFQNE